MPDARLAKRVFWEALNIDIRPYYDNIDKNRIGSRKNKTDRN